MSQASAKPAGSFRVTALATAAPCATVDQQQLADWTRLCCATREGQPEKVARIFAGSGVQQRGSVLHDADEPVDAAAFQRVYPMPDSGPEAVPDGGPTISQRMQWYETHALPLAQRAAAGAIAQAGVDPADVAQLVVVSCTGFSSPGVDIKLIEALGLPATTGRTLVGFMGCHGALNGLRVARGLAHAAPGQTVLLCCVELCTLHFQYGYHPEHIVANALFADGAAALVARCEADDSPPASGTLRLLDQQSVIVPRTQDAMTWRIRDQGFEMGLSIRVPRHIEAHLRPWLEGWLASHGLAVSDVAHWAVHPGGPRVLSAVEQSLQLPAGACVVSREVLARHGNMSSPTLLFILDELRRRQVAGRCVALAFGPGLTIEAALLELC